jgi:DNA-binding response OmpR family regulator
MDPLIQHNDRVLVVEDEVDISSSLAYALRASGYEVLVADRGTPFDPISFCSI